MGPQLSLRQILSFFWRRKILGLILVICMTGLSFLVTRKSVERVILLNKSKLEVKLPYLKGKPKFEMPSNGNIEYYNISISVDKDIECKQLQTIPSPFVCLYNSSIDATISNRIKNGGVYENMYIHIFQDMLKEDEELGLLDLGANIGLYSLVAAAMKRSVLAVEPVEGNLKRLAKAVQINGYQDLITVLPYAITNIHTKLSMALNPNNQGAHRLLVDKKHDIYPERQKVDVATILMDDLEPYVPFKKAIMKIDIEGQEHRAFVHSKALMDKVEVPYILMEWVNICRYNRTGGTEDNYLTLQLIDLLTGYGYTPFKTSTFQKEKLKLQTEYWGKWPGDIIWSKRDK